MLDLRVASAVLGVDVQRMFFSVTLDGKTNILYQYGWDIDGTNGEKIINVYQLSWMCKDWVYKNYGLVVAKNHRTWKKYKPADYKNDYEAEAFYYGKYIGDTITQRFIEDNEYDAVFRATEWIYKREKERND